MESNSVASQAGKTNILALLSVISGGLALLLGLVSLILAFFVAVPGFICASAGGLFSVAALVLGILGLIQVNRGGSAEKGKGLAIAGIAMGGLGLLTACLVPLITMGVMGWSGMSTHMRIPRFWRMH